MKDHLAKTGLAIVLISLSSPAFAYLDGATGSMLLQGVIGGVATAMVFGRSYLAKAKAFLGRGASRSKSNGTADS